MSWNYRVTKQKIEDDYVYEIREVYYEPLGWTENAILPSAFESDEESWKESLRWQLEAMLLALERDVIDIGENK